MSSCCQFPIVYVCQKLWKVVDSWHMFIKLLTYLLYLLTVITIIKGWRFYGSTVYNCCCTDYVPALCQVKRGRLIQVTTRSWPLVNNIIPVDTLAWPDPQYIVAEWGLVGSWSTHVVWRINNTDIVYRTTYMPHIHNDTIQYNTIQLVMVSLKTVWLHVFPTHPTDFPQP